MHLKYLQSLHNFVYFKDMTYKSVWKIPPKGCQMFFLKYHSLYLSTHFSPLLCSKLLLTLSLCLFSLTPQFLVYKRQQTYSTNLLPTDLFFLSLLSTWITAMHHYTFSQLYLIPHTQANTSNVFLSVLCLIYLCMFGILGTT